MVKFFLRSILTSAGSWTVECILNYKGYKFRSSIPIGTSVSKYEVRWDLRKFKRLKLNLRLRDLDDLLRWERKMYGKIPTLPISFSFLKFLAWKKGIEVYQLFSKKARKPILIHKVVGGGAHAEFPEFQEFLIISDLKRIKKAYKFHAKLGEKINARGKDLEGGWVCDLSNEEILSLIKWRRKGIDVAASQFYKDGFYIYHDRRLSREGQIEYINQIVKRYKLEYVEDPLHEDDFEGFAQIKAKLVIGDDLTCTNPERLRIAIENESVNACLVKPNQIGYLFKLIEFCELAKENGIKLFASHRSKDTCDPILADLCVAFCDGMKIGLFGGERTQKLNRLFEIFRIWWN